MKHCPNPDCLRISNPDTNRYCQGCGTLLEMFILRGRYRLLQPLGEGGFGKTYLAEDLDKRNERCVVKQFYPNIQGTQALEIARSLFEEEGKQLQQLGTHPQIPALHAYFEENNQLYLVQEYISGITLEQELMDQGVFSEEKIIKVLREILTVLDFIHTKNVIHRDIKPANIIRCNHSSNHYLEPDSFVLIDFGIAKQLQNTVVNSNNTRIGTYGYVPIEQMEAGKVFPSSDLYSLGATCFHLLSDVNPWELWKLQGYSWVGNWKSHINSPITVHLETVLNKLLQVYEKNRYQSAKTVLDDLNSLIISSQSLKNTSHNSISTQKTVALFPNNNRGNQLTNIQSLGRKNLVTGNNSLAKKRWQPLIKVSSFIVLGTLSASLLRGIFPYVPTICNILNNCSVDQDFNATYEKVQKEDNRSLKSSPKSDIKPSNTVNVPQEPRKPIISPTVTSKTNQVESQPKRKVTSTKPTITPIDSPPERRKSVKPSTPLWGEGSSGDKSNNEPLW